ncbi:MAG: carbohydrate ABC transporter permease [Tumebacillaceae bacterium]
MNRIWKNRLLAGGLQASYALIIVFFLFPIFWVFSLSLKSIPELFATPPLWFSSAPHFENYVHVFQHTNILPSLWNSLEIVLLTVAFALLVAIPAAYGLSRFTFRHKKLSLLLILIFQMISPIVVAIPLYRFFVKLDLLNTEWSLILVYVAVELPFTTWFLKGYFDTIPRELDEAAIMDGCTRGQYVRRVLLPVGAPGLASAAILVAVQSWSQFVIPFVLLDKGELFPVSVALVNLQSTSEAVTLHYLAAASIIGILPVILGFILLQKYIVGALTSGAVKG